MTRYHHPIEACLGLLLYIRFQLFCRLFFDSGDCVTSIMIFFHTYDVTESVVITDTSVIFIPNDFVRKITSSAVTSSPSDHLTLSFTLIVAFSYLHLDQALQLRRL